MKEFKCNLYNKNKIKNKTYKTVGTVPKYTRLSEQFQKIQDCQNSSKRYKTVRTVPKDIRLSEQFWNIQDCQNSSKTYKTVRTVPKSNRKIVKRGKIDTPYTITTQFPSFVQVLQGRIQSTFLFDLLL